MSMILVTGGAGYIGSHTCIELLAAGYEIIVADNYSNSCPEAVKRVKELSGKEFEFVECEICDIKQVETLFKSRKIDAVIHFAGLKAVGESVEKPLSYYQNNLISTLNIIECMKKYGTESLVFSSSATVYGDPASVPINEEFPLQVTNPYGRTKLMIEDMLRDIAIAEKDLRIAILRYFNPIGAHPSGRIGENPNDIPNNLLPYIAQVAVGKLKKLSIFGDDYLTVDGTGVRDYIHVVDLSKGHVAALHKLEKEKGVHTYNLGTGNGYSVLQILHAFEKVSGKAVPYQIVARRPGDVAQCYANPDKASNELGWKAIYGVEEMCSHTWNWQKNNPNGYEK